MDDDELHYIYDLNYEFLKILQTCQRKKIYFLTPRHKKKDKIELYFF